MKQKKVFLAVSLALMTLMSTTNTNARYWASENRDFITVGDYSYYIYPGDKKEVKLISYATEANLDTWHYCYGTVNLPETIEYEGEEYTVTGLSAASLEIQLDGINLPKTLRVIEWGNFFATYKFLNLNEGVEVMMDGCIVEGEFDSLHLPSSLRYIGNECVIACKMNEITFSEGLMSIGAESFCKLPNITTIELPQTLQSLGEGCFRDNESLTSVTLARNTPSYYNCFNGCPNITRVEITNVLQLPEIRNCFDEVDFDKCVLVIPDGYKESELYKDMMRDDLTKFKIIVEKSQESSLGTVLPDETAESSTYLLNGMQLPENSTPKSGEILIKKTGGKVQKVMAK